MGLLLEYDFNQALKEGGKVGIFPGPELAGGGREKKEKKKKKERKRGENKLV